MVWVRGSSKAGVARSALVNSVDNRGRLFQGLDVGDQVGTVLRLLQAGEHHLGARDILLRVLQVLEQGILVPGDA